MQKPIHFYLEQYLQTQAPEDFLDLRQAMVASPDYTPYGGYTDQARSLLEQGQFKEAKDYLMSLMPTWLLNPGIHRLASFAFHKLGQDQDARFEYGLAMLLIAGILSTGDGSEARPFLVLYTADEYDVLDYLGKESRSQSLVERDGRFYDCQQCEEDVRIWFDITIPYGYLQRQFSPKG